jgi:hypothetical protein
MYWAQGLTDTYLDGALLRATRERVVVPREPLIAAPRFDAPAPPSPRGYRPSHAILDPFATFGQGEDLLRKQLNALSHDNLVAIVDDYGLAVHGMADMPAIRLAEAIVGVVRARSAGRHPQRTETKRATPDAADKRT